MSTVIIFAAGETPSIVLLDELPQPDVVIAADGGFLIADGMGFSVDTIVGDMDSLPNETIIPASTERIVHSIDKGATDLELAFELAIRHQPARIVLIGAEGGRFDHEVATIETVASDRWFSIPEIDWVRSDSTCHVIRGTRRIQGDVGATISLIPIGGDAGAVTATGLKWPLDIETLHSGATRGMSNRFKKPEAVISVGEGVLVAIVPRQESDG